MWFVDAGHAHGQIARELRSWYSVKFKLPMHHHLPPAASPASVLHLSTRKIAQG